MKLKLKNFKPNNLWYAVCSSSMIFTWLMTSSVVQASDLQIYASPTAGKKTIVMMLDTSGSMTSNSYGENRLAMLKNGMNAFLASNNPVLNDTRVGLGNFSADGDSRSGQILVAAAPLGDASTLNTMGSQRYKLKQAVASLTASGYTPSAHAYAEAAAYLMGTTTLKNINLVDAPIYFSYVTYDRRGRVITNYHACTEWNTEGTICNSWDSSSLSNPPVISGLQQASCTANIGWQLLSGTCYKKTGLITINNLDSGFNKSISGSKNTDQSQYNSPLPAVANRQSCDGQGIYFLSDGEPNKTTDTRSASIMSTALGSTFGADFNCSGGLSNTTADSGWACMGEFAKRLFDKTKNPAGVSIQTAFVGFGSDFSSLSSSDVKNACRLSSRTQFDRGGDDLCSPNQTTNAITAPGYGNGGFFSTQSAQGVTDSVIAFINNLDKVPLEPLTTGAISVPYDALNPKNLQEYGYLRAFEPNPANTYLTWRGNLKKYHVVLSGTNAGAFEANTGGLVYNATGAFRTGTKDYWNSSTYNDGGKVFFGGSYAKVPLPIAGQNETRDAEGNITKYYYAVQSKIRNLFTDVSAVAADGSLTKISTSGTNLLKIPAAPPEGTNPFDTVANTASYVLGKFDPSTGQNILKAFPISLKLKILNYLGYSTDISATTLPSSLVTSNEPYLSMGGSIHSLPVQLTYNGTLDDNGNLTSAREQSILYGTMEGGLHIVDASSGIEQMVFVPADILNDSVASKALVVGQSDASAPAHGMDGAWVSDPAYNITTVGSGSSAVSKVTAKQMNIYGGMRMGGSSYYGLDVLSPTSPKLLFRIGADQTDYSRMGQSWSKPVLANIRYNGSIRRVLIVGGGYDQCYEKPNITLTDACFTNGKAKGNAVYIIDAKTGQRLWWTSDTGSNTDNANMKHSIVSRISTLDRDADGLVDHLYFGDLGGQIFRVDLNNNQTKTNSTYSSFGVRVVRLANLATNDSTYDGTNDYTGGNAPRFYEPPTVTIHDYGIHTFITVGIASGDRSTPLDVYPLTGREGMTPTSALSGRPVNNVYGIIDRDFVKKNLMSLTDNQLETKDITRTGLRKNPQILRTGETRVAQIFFPTTGVGKGGWYRSLSSTSDGTEKANNSFRIKGGLKAFEEPMAITGNLIIPVYDPQGTGIVAADPCLPRVVGETDRQTYCLPFGACLNSDGSIDQNKENHSGFETQTGTNCPVGASECNKNVIGSGIRSVTFVPTEDNPPMTNSCGKLKLSGNEQGTGQWQCTSHLVPTRWYERYR
ncbi:PilC/PilY family type IV pilus protein [Acinetobacter baumannii]|uniref:PilC/PilY family type IV pilus protein n=1 Tax=Acinetobacter TaxID=469 RepID=UPI0002BAD38D|nr:PilC/PilY family type IV pilus protein [Acinetobacter baumannii]AGH36935.1 pilus assembly protein tip-associated adhesin PilY1 [Acinetobacter baumannii D1279779]EHZ6730481.1 VWA domain-containing protein [Acinetobacter baumannii]EKT8701207.1 VWA domain-containing protein [Acinetobacter baumannii]EKT9842235.1 VWA domain-containing protein [Acinetobacter baumannii]EKT9846591.1 VWA domain-containing protein [Acinetobacter baumannii]